MKYAWAIFQYDTNALMERWKFHSAHWSRDRARALSKGIEGITHIRKISYEIIQGNNKR